MTDSTRKLGAGHLIQALDSLMEQNLKQNQSIERMKIHIRRLFGSTIKDFDEADEDDQEEITRFVRDTFVKRYGNLDEAIKWFRGESKMWIDRLNEGLNTRARPVVIIKEIKKQFGEISDRDKKSAQPEAKESMVTEGF